jgi:Ca2+-binding RTX toxin-like protein
MGPELSRRDRRAVERRIRKELEAEARQRLGRSPRGLRRELAALATVLAGAGAWQGIAAENAWAPTAVEYAFANGELIVTGTNAPDSVNVFCSDGKVNVQDRPTEIGCSEVTSIAIKIGRGDDTLDLAGVSAERFTSLTDGHISIFGEQGADLIQGSALADTMRGGYGDDTLSGLFGNDTISGESGDDSHFGGWGNDWLIGGPGGDALTGGDGEDVLIDNSGENTLVQEGPNGPNEHDPNDTQ